jgi:hypothetical protein
VLSLLSKGVEKMGVLLILVVALNVVENRDGGDVDWGDEGSCDGGGDGSVVAGAGVGRCE